MEILENYNLKYLNTFGIEVKAKYFVEINTEDDLRELFQHDIFKQNKRLFLGGGSNVLFTHDFAGIVILNKLKGIKVLKEDEESVDIYAFGGEVWHDLVLFAVDKNLWGIENLSLVPGSVGAAPMQNIGAYGAELKNVLESVEVYDINTGEKKIFKKHECNFGYRESIFKNIAKDKYFIVGITLRLSKKENKNIEYRVLSQYLKENNIEVKQSKDISEAVANIRRSKLPDPKVIGNAGSFFKNIFIDEEKLKELFVLYPNMPFFKEDDSVKISSAWLIEQCGPIDGTSWKGYRFGNVGVHAKQALVLINYGGAKGEEVKKLAEDIIDSVFNKFGLRLDTEVNLI